MDENSNHNAGLYDSLVLTLFCSLWAFLFQKHEKKKDLKKNKN